MEYRDETCAVPPPIPDGEEQGASMDCITFVCLFFFFCLEQRNCYCLFEILGAIICSNVLMFIVVDFGTETTTFHGAPAVAPGRTWVDPPAHLRNVDHRCYLPKKRIHTW